MTRLAFSIPTGSEPEQRQLFDGFSQHGFEGLQLKGGQYLRYLDEPGRFQEDWGSRPSACSGLIYGGDLGEDGQERLRRVLSFAAALGSERVIFCHGLSRAGLTDGDLRGFARTLSRIGEDGKPQGVTLSLHHHYNQPVMSREDMRVFFGAVEPGTVGLTLDTAHLVKSGVTDIAGVIQEFAGSLDNVHLKDFAGGEFRPLGQGGIDFGPVFSALRQIGYDGWLCADEESGASVEEGMRVAHAFITRHWQGGQVHV